MIFRRKRVSRRIIGRFRKPEPTPELPIEQLVEDGRMMAHGAARMAVKNHLIVRAAGDRRDLDVEAAVDVARARLLELAGEQDEAARREAGGYVDARHERDELHRSSRRRQVLRRLAAVLEQDAAGDVARELVDSALDSAWAEIGRAVIERARGVEEDPSYATERASRLEAFAGDLAALAADAATGSAPEDAGSDGARPDGG